MEFKISRKGKQPVIMKKPNLALSLSILLILGIISFGEPLFAQDSSSFVEEIENQHKLKKFQKYDWIAFDIKLQFGGKERLNGRVYSKTNSSMMRLDYSDGTRLIFDGQKVYSNKKPKSEQSAIFDLFTWQYFFVAPYKFSDPGTVWDYNGSAQLQNTDYETAKLSFAPGTGVSHRDWYLVYADENSTLQAMAYIVTLGKSTDEANQEPHAITYTAYETVRGIPFASEWKFWDWSAEAGLAAQLGEAQISNITLGKKADDTFNINDSDLVIMK